MCPCPPPTDVDLLGCGGNEPLDSSLPRFPCLPKRMTTNKSCFFSRESGEVQFISADKALGVLE